MTDGWPPIGRDRPPPAGAGAVEIELTGPAGGAAPDRTDPADGPQPRGRGRPAVAGAAIVGVLVAGIGAVLILMGDDETADPAATSGPGPTELTTPSTLPPLDVIAPPDPRAPDATSSQDRSLFDPDERATARLPTYPEFGSVSAEQAAGFGLEDAVAGLDDDVPIRARTEYVVGASGYSVLAIITHVPRLDRYEALLTYDLGTTRVVVDVPGDAIYVASDDEWLRTSLGDVPTGSAGAGFDDLLHRLVLGPIRPDTLDDVVSVDPRAVVTLDLGRTAAQEYEVAIPARAIPEWSRYALGATGDAPPPADADTIVYSVYVDENGMVRRVQGASAYGATSQTIVHSIDRLPDDATIALPDPATIRDAP